MEIKKDTVFDVAVTTEQGCEEFLKQELEQRFKIENIALGENWTTFRATTEVVAQVMYSSQAAKRVTLLLEEGSFKDIEELERVSKDMASDKVDMIAFFLNNRTFRVVCDRTGHHDFNSVDAEQTVSAAVREALKGKESDGKAIETKLSLNKPDITLYLRIIEGKYLLGIDCAGRELSKRQHLVFNNAIATKGTIGYCALLFAGYRPGLVVLDPFALSGNIMLEAALYESGTPVNYYTKHFTLMDIPEFRPLVDDVLSKTDSKIKSPPSTQNLICSDSTFNNVSAQKKNAKIAGVDKFIAFARTDIENLDIKSLASEIDIVCTRVIEPSANIAESKARKIYETLFKNLKFITKKKSSFVFVLRNPALLEEEAAKLGYVVVGRKEVFQGQQAFWFVKMGRGE